MSKRKPKIGFLPLYIKIYDDKSYFMREKVDKYVSDTAGRLAAAGLEVVAAPICRIKPEFDAAVESFEKNNVDLIITLNAAYSPSLESYEALSSTKLPILVLDTTMDYEFTPYTYADGMLYNHGIHGVMDLCNMLRRSGKKYEIIAGYFSERNPGYAELVSRVGAFAEACVIKKTLSASRVGLVGTQFVGMGDFRIPFDVLNEKLGIEVVEYDMEKGKKFLASVTDKEIDDEYRLDCERFEMKAGRKVYDTAARTGLAVRKWIEAEKLNAFTMNFSSAARGTGFPTMPFSEASIAMSKGVGYAGEGDVMTAAFVGALMSVFGEVSFTEIFCPDWKNGSLFVSHMGEYNVALSSSEHKPVMSEKDFMFGDAENPTVVLAPFKAGRAVFVSLNPGPDDTFSVYFMPGEMLFTPFENQQSYVVNGWFKPDMKLPEFLEDYSKAGGIHHAALVYGDKNVADVLENLCKII